MTLVRNPATKVYEIDIKDRSIGRLHLSLRTRVQKEAMPRHDAIEALVRDGQVDLVDLLRGRRIRVEAVEACRRERRPWDSLRQQSNPWPTVTDAAAQYIAWVKANPNKNGGTAPTAQTQLASFRAFQRPKPAGDSADGLVLPRMGELRLDDVSTDDVTAYQTTLVAEAYAVNSVRAYVARIGTLYRWAQRREDQRAKGEKRAPRLLHIPLDPEVQARGRTVRERFLTVEEATRLIAATPDGLLFPVLAGLFAGLRVGEMLHLRTPPYDVDLEAGLLIVQEKQIGEARWRPKSGDRREVPIATDLRPVLERHLARYASPLWVVPGIADPSRPLFDRTFEAHFTRIVRDAGLVTGRDTAEGVTYHTLRHTFASWLVMRGVDLYAVAKLLGNTLKMVETTYGHLAPEHRRRAVDQLSGVLAIPTPDDEAKGLANADIATPRDTETLEKARASL